MRIYIMTDMEGVAGIVNWDDYGAPGARCYERACELTTREVNAAIEGFSAAGATDFLVVDGHGAGAIDPVVLHPKARLLAGRPGAYPFGCDESFAAACQIGQHAKSNTDGGHLSHTGSFTVDELTINGRSVGEMGCNMLFCGWFGVPTVMVSGCAAAAEEARGLVPGIETAAVKEGLRRGPAHELTGDENKLFNGVAIHHSPEVARELIREAAFRAVSRLAEFEPFRMVPPFDIVRVMRPLTRGGWQQRSRGRSDDMIELLSMPLEGEWIPPLTERAP